jgi:hypothetical protein
MNFNDTIIALHAEIKGRDEVISLQEDQLETQAAEIAGLLASVMHLHSNISYWKGLKSE